MTVSIDHSQQQQLSYTAYLVRLWQDSAHSGSLAELFTFLETASTGAAQA